MRTEETNADGATVQDVVSTSAPPADVSARVAAPSIKSRLFSRRTVVSMLLAASIVAVGVWRAGIDWSAALRNIRHANVGVYLLAIAAFYFSFAIRSIRWQLLLRNAGEERRARSLVGIVITSFFVNCVVPAKLGDVYRAIQVRERERIGATMAFGTIIAERLVDLLVLMVLLAIAGALTFGGRVPRQLMPYFIGGVVLCIARVSFVVLLSRGRGQRLLVRLPERMVERYEHFRTGTVHALSGNWLQIIALSVLVWGLEGTRLGLAGA